MRLSTSSACIAALGGQLRLCATLVDGKDVDLTRVPQAQPVDAARD